MLQARGVWSQLTKEVWPCTRGTLWGSSTSAPPLFCCLKLRKTSASTCSRDSESEWERGLEGSDWLSCGLRGRGLVTRNWTLRQILRVWTIMGAFLCSRKSVEAVFMTKTQTPRMPCASPRSKCQTSLSLFLPLSSRAWTNKVQYSFKITRNQRQAETKSSHIKPTFLVLILSNILLISTIMFTRSSVHWHSLNVWALLFVFVKVQSERAWLSCRRRQWWREHSCLLCC